MLYKFSMRLRVDPSDLVAWHSQQRACSPSKATAEENLGLSCSPATHDPLRTGLLRPHFGPAHRAEIRWSPGEAHSAAIWENYGWKV